MRERSIATEGSADTHVQAINDWTRGLPFLPFVTVGVALLIALADMPAVTIDRAVSDWVRANTKWPRPFDIRELADAHQRARAADAGTRHKVHSARIVAFSIVDELNSHIGVVLAGDLPDALHAPLGVRVGPFLFAPDGGRQDEVVELALARRREERLECHNTDARSAA